MKIIKNEPIPFRYDRGSSEFTKLMKTMEVGDCIEATDNDYRYNSLMYRARKCGIKITIRKTQTGFRVWRIK